MISSMTRMCKPAFTFALLVLCMLAYALLKQQPPPPLVALGETYCSRSAGSVSLNDDYGFDVSQKDCGSRCSEHVDCNMYTHGTWLMGLPPPFGMRGKKRCQLYSECYMQKMKRMTVYMKRKPADTTMEQLLGVASLVLLLAFGWSVFEGSSRHPSTVASDRCKEAVVSEVKLPPWRREECQAPAWPVLAMAFSALAELPWVMSIVSMPKCAAASQSLSQTLLTFASSLTSWVLAGFKTEACAPKALIASFVCVTFAWLCIILVITFLSDLRNTIILPTCCLGLVSLALQVCLAAHFLTSILIFGTIMHGLGFVLLCYCKSVSDGRTAEATDAESKRSSFERSLIEALFAMVQTRCRELQDTSRWVAMVDICTHVGALVLFGCLVWKVGQDTVYDSGPVLWVVRVLGFNVTAIVRYALIVIVSALFANSLVHLCVTAHAGVQRLCASPEQRLCKALCQKAVEIGEKAARCWSIHFEHPQGSTGDDDLIELSSQELDSISARITGDSAAVRVLRRQSSTDLEDTLSPGAGLKYTRAIWRRSIQDMAMEELTHRRDELEKKFTSDTEDRTKAFARDLSSAADETANRIGRAANATAKSIASAARCAGQAAKASMCI